MKERKIRAALFISLGKSSVTGKKASDPICTHKPEWTVSLRRTVGKQAQGLESRRKLTFSAAVLSLWPAQSLTTILFSIAFIPHAFDRDFQVGAAGEVVPLEEATVRRGGGGGGADMSGS